MKKILIIGLLFLLPSCSQLQKDFETIKSGVVSIATPDNFDTVTIFYGSVEATANAYRDTCERKIINKSCWLTIAKLQPYEQKAYDAYIALKNFVKANPNADATTFIQLLRSAATAFHNAQSDLGVK